LSAVSSLGTDGGTLYVTYTEKARDASRITAAEMIYMRRTAGYIWTVYKTNLRIAKELKIAPTLDKLLEYKRNWIQHVNRMSRKTAQGTETVLCDWQKESWQTFEEASGHVRLERVNKWPNCMTDK
jgi:1,2-phenylacetyl-CoA epoxidase PaaB subunit